MRILPIFLLVLLAGCMTAGPPPYPIVAKPEFKPLTFFAGMSNGEGRLKILLSKSRSIRVHSEGRSTPGGTLILDQSISEDGKPASRRQWNIRQVAPGRFSGTLSDAGGPISGDVDGNRLHLSFPMKGGLQADQWLSLSSDGQTAQNHMTVRKFGVVVATLDETIRRAA